MLSHHSRLLILHPSSLILHHPVTAPSAADDTSLAYLASAPLVWSGGRGDQSRRRASISSALSATEISRFGASIVTRSPSRSAAIGPPTAASGATWPTTKPCEAPEKRPSVISATLPPRPRPMIAPVTASISRMPGPPFGPS